MFTKVRFTSKNHGSTAGLILDARKLQDMSIGDISRLFPYSEAMRMQRLETSPSYETWEEAFNHEFK